MAEAVIFKFPYNLFIKQRMEFVVICQDHLAAGILRIIEKEILRRKEAWQDQCVDATEAKKPLPKEPDYWIRLSYAQIIAKLYRYDTAKVKGDDGKQHPLGLSRGTLRKAIEHLKSLGFILERSKQGDEFGAPIWTLHMKNIQDALDALPENYFSIFNQIGGGAKFVSGEVQNFNLPGTNSVSGEVQNFNINKDNSKESLSENKKDDNNSAPENNSENETDSTDVPASPSFSEEEEETNPEHPSEEQPDETQQPPLPEEAVEEQLPRRRGRPRKTSAPEGETPPEKEKNKRTRTPKVSKVSPEDLALYRDVLDHCRKEALDDEDEGYAHSKPNDECIMKLLENNLSRPGYVTPERLHKVFLRMWNTPRDPRTNFYMREHMSIKAICNNYDTQLMALKNEAHARQGQQQQTQQSEEEQIREAIRRIKSGETTCGPYQYRIGGEPIHYPTAEDRNEFYSNRNGRKN